MTKNIKFTDEALKQIEKIILENKPEKFFRITVQGGGCSGFKYNFSFDKKVRKNDLIFNKTIIDKQSLDIIDGSTIDFNKEMIKTELNLILKGKRNQIQKDYKDLRNLLKGEDIESKIVNHIINN